ncbi:hypothetical protein CLAIMM_02906 [Cladophialophora immunda]|nr:hypothetical protein CLAIMM_02906 [Cladophialophora immunda]
MSLETVPRRYVERTTNVAVEVGVSGLGKLKLARYTCTPWRERSSDRLTPRTVICFPSFVVSGTKRTPLYNFHSVRFSHQDTTLQALRILLEPYPSRPPRSGDCGFDVSTAAVMKTCEETPGSLKTYLCETLESTRTSVKTR